MKKNDQSISYIGNILILFIFTSIAISFYFNFIDENAFGIKCKVKALMDDDKYCLKTNTCDGYNITIHYGYGNCIDTFVLRSHSQDKIDEENRIKRVEQDRKVREERLACYNSGKDYDYNFTIFGNYNLSCSKIAYLNDHLVDEVRQMDGGYIRGSYSGFISHGSVEGHLYQYVVVGNLATGKLMKHISYHLDCNNQTLNKIEEYFTKEEFIMEYVNKCIGE